MKGGRARIPTPRVSWSLSAVTPRRRPPPTPARLRSAIAVGAALAWRGWLVRFSALFGVITAVVFAIIAAVVNRRAVADVPAATSTAMAWGAGVLVAFAAALRAFRLDRTRGVRALFHARGATSADYARGRTLGLALVLLALVGGATLVCGGIALLTAPTPLASARTAAGLGAALVYGGAFAAVIAPLSLAALGGRTRAGGYVGLLVLLVLPELAEPWTSRLVPEAWGDLLSVPSALAGLRSAIAPDLDVARMARAACVLALFAVLSYALARTEIARVDAEDEESLA
jgi:hypothetical protein